MSHYVPSYAVTYNCLGDQECFTMKYTWELAVYFCFYVIPAINGFWANQRFMRQFLRRYGAMGSINHTVQRMLSALFEWKKTNPRQASGMVDSGGRFTIEGLPEGAYDVFGHAHKDGVWWSASGRVSAGGSVHLELKKP